MTLKFALTFNYEYMAFIETESFFHGNFNNVKIRIITTNDRNLVVQYFHS